MTKEEKEIKEIKKDIEERLRLSDKNLWKSLSEEKRQLAIDKYLEIRNKSGISIDEVLEVDYTRRKDFMLLMLGMLIGIIGNIFADAFLLNLRKLFNVDENPFLYVIFCFLCFYLLVSIILRQIQKNSAENLCQNKVLEKLIKNQPSKMKTITKKIDTIWFDAVEQGRKKFELRLADFDIEEGDIIRLEEWVGEGSDRKPTGRVIEKQVNYLRKVNLKDWIERQPELLEDGMYVIQFD